MPLASSTPFYLLLCFVFVAFVPGSMDIPALLAEVTRTREATTVAEATRVAMVLAIETFAQEAAVTWDSATLCVKGAEDQTTLVEMEALERVSRVEAQNDVALASAHEDAEGFIRKIVLLEGERGSWIGQLSERGRRTAWGGAGCTMRGEC
jgi:hypothetical protein